MPLTVASWNINSIRARLDGLGRLVAAVEPDVVCLQETRVGDALFPAAAARALGYPHIAAHGAKGHGGVAVLSRRPILAPAPRAWCGRTDARHLAATIDGGPALGPLDVHSLYVPAGGDLPDPALNPRFAHKLEFLDALAPWSAAVGASGRPAVLAGDFNVAPLPEDVWSHRIMRRIVTHTPAEVERLERAQAAAPWTDAVRHFVPPPTRLSTWWSYRAADWRAADRGRRLDHLWVTAPLVPRLAALRIVEEARDWPRPSDHAPLAVTFGD